MSRFLCLLSELMMSLLAQFLLVCIFISLLNLLHYQLFILPKVITAFLITAWLQRDLKEACLDWKHHALQVVAQAWAACPLSSPLASPWLPREPLALFLPPWLPLGFHGNSPVLLEGSRCPWKEGVFCIPGRSVLICQLGSMGWFPANLLSSFLREGYWNLWLWLWIYFFFQLYQLCFLYFKPLVLGA